MAGGLALACWATAARGQAGYPREARIGWLSGQRAPGVAVYLDALRAGLAERGFVEGRNLTIEYRYADDELGRVPALAAELARARVDLIVAQGAAVPSLIGLGRSVPIVFAFSGDPIAARIADSLSQPGENMTGITFMAVEFNAKRIEMLRDVIPGLQRIALVGNPQHAGEHLERAHAEQVARKLDLSMSYFPVRTQAELDPALDSMIAGRPQGVLLLADAFAIQNRQRIIGAATANRVPVISGWPVFAEAGALITYGPHLPECYRRLAHYVDRILQGAKPRDLPIERPTKFQLVVNQRAARALEIELPASLLARADEVIE